MLRKLLFPSALLTIWALGGCGSAENADSIAKLQEQIGRLAQQLNETKKQVDGLQEANQRSVRSLDELEATVERLTSTPTTSGGGKTVKGDASPTGAHPQGASPPQASLSPGKSSQKVLVEQDI